MRELETEKPNRGINWQVIEERVDSSEDAAQQFVWNIGYIDDLLLRDRDTNGDSSLDERLYALTDLRYTVMALANTSGTIVERFRYEAHGRSVALNADFAPRAESFYAWQYRYTGRELDLQTGLLYFRNRYYHADLGRFISRDPIGYVDGVSLYRGYYVPKTFDPIGLTMRAEVEFDSTANIFVSRKALAYTGTKVFSPIADENLVRPQEEGTDLFTKSEDGCCASVKQAKALAIDVYMLLPNDGVESGFFNSRGIFETILHEYRRLLVFVVADLSFLQPSEKNGKLALRCGERCGDDYEQSEKMLTEYLNDLRKWAKWEYEQYVKRQQILITQEVQVNAGAAKPGSDAAKFGQPIMGGYANWHPVNLFPKPFFPPPKCKGKRKKKTP